MTIEQLGLPLIARRFAMMESGQQYTHNLQAHEAKLQSEDDAQINLTMVNEDLNQ
jgi:hypothetical protein